MGKGDQKSRKGKIAIGSYGKRRPHKLKKKVEKAEVAEIKPAKK
jgi:ribosomal small subunit protein bTHX